MTVTLANNSEYAKLRNVNDYDLNVSASSSTKKTNSDNSIFSDGCSDGKDDGSIGLGSAIGHFVKGAGNSVVNAVKSCFTDDNGEFSVGKTLFTLGTGAVCVAFPPVGLALCGIGLAAGTYQAGKGIINFINAKTDAEAKQALQNTGSGVVTAGTSAIGGKMAFGAMKNAAKMENGVSAINSMSRKKNVSLSDKVSAFGEDALASMSNGAKNLISDVPEAAISGASKVGNGISKAANGISDAGKSVSSTVNSISKKMSQKRINRRINARAKGKTFKGNTKLQTVSDFASSVRESLHLKKGIGKVSSSVIDGVKKLGGNSLDILRDLTAKNGSYNKAVQKYGYDNVAKVMTIIAAKQVQA